MPLYDYECGHCGHVFELRQSFDADPQGTCPRCEGVSRRKFHAVPIIFKGSGFYTTDYKNNSFASTAKKEEEADSPADSSKDKASKTKETSATSEKEPETSATVKGGGGGSKDKATASK